MLFILQVSILSEQTPFFPTGPASLLVVIRGFPHHFIDTGASNNEGFIDILGFKLKR